MKFTLLETLISAQSYLSAVRMKSVKNSSIGEKEGGGRGPPTILDDGRKKRSVNLKREEKEGGRGERDRNSERRYKTNFTIIYM